MAVHRIPSAFPLLFRDLCWKIPVEDNIIYLTFDDGPEPTVTSYVLDLLKSYNASATFFCIGKNVEAHPEVFNRIVSEGHAVGNHTYSHLKGWNTDTTSYLEDVDACTRFVDSKLFRPPYGKISYRQYKELSKRFTIVLWDVITHDYDVSLDKEVALKKSIKSVKPGSVVIFHDSLKARKNLEFMLPALLRHFADKGYRFESLSPELCKGAIS